MRIWIPGKDEDTAEAVALIKRHSAGSVDLTSPDDWNPKADRVLSLPETITGLVVFVPVFALTLYGVARGFVVMWGWFW